MSNSDFFVQTAVAHARTLPFADAVKFLGGLLELVGDQPEVAHVRRAYTLLNDSDRQLDLIAAGQLKLALPAQPSRSRKAS